MKKQAISLFILGTIALILLPAATAHAQSGAVFQTPTHIAEVNYAEGTVSILTDNGYFSSAYDDQALSLYLETAQRNRFPVIVYHTRESVGDSGDWYGEIKKLVSVEMGALVIDQNGCYIDRDDQTTAQIQVEQPDPDYVKKPQSVTTTIKGTKTEWYEGEWFEIETSDPKYPSFGIYKDEFNPEAFEKLEAVVNTVIKERSEVTFHFLAAPKTNITLTQISFKGRGSVKLK